MEQITTGQPFLESGELDWSFYGDTFDTRLFELWSVSVISRALADVLDADWSPPVLLDRHRRAMFAWSTTAGDVALYFQRSLPSLGLGLNAKWQRTDTARRLRGTPDITAVVTPLNGSPAVVLLDPKLRQRDSAPVEELYKILGYFNNYGLGEAGRGAIIFYAGAENPRVLSYTSPSAGLLVAASVDPERVSDNAGSVAALVALILQPLGLELLTAAVDAGSTQAVEESEYVAANAQRIQVEMLRSIAQSLGPMGVQPWMSQGEALFGDSWRELAADVQEIIATAIYVGNALSAERDFSGPVLGLAAAAESLIWHHVLEPASLSCPQVADTKMLGAAIALIERAVSGQDRAPEQAVRHVLESRPGLLTGIAELVDQLQEMNREFRRPAAHRTLLSRSRWLACHRFMLVGSAPMLPRLAEVLAP